MNFANNIDWALYYLNLGLSVFPVSKFKQPVIKWQEFQNRLPTEYEIKDWWNKWPNASIGFATGKLSGIVVLDAESSVDIKEFSKIYSLPTTAIVKTGGGGWHFYFKHPGFEIRNGTRIMPGWDVDFRGDGGYAILPPSLHKSGNEYEWSNLLESKEDLTEMPSWLIDVSKKSFKEIAQGTSEGNRNSGLTSILGKLRNEISEDLWPMVGKATAINYAKKCTPPMPEEEAISVFNSVSNYQGKKSIEIKKNKTETKNKIVRELIEKFNVKTCINKKDRDIFIYQDGIYKSGEHILRKHLEGNLEDCTMHTKNELLDKIKDQTGVEVKAFEVGANLINFKNGILNIQTKEFICHSPEYLFLHQIPVIYDPAKDCPGIKNFLNQILPEADIEIIKEWLGFCLYRRYFIKKALIMVGERDTGKTTLARLMKNFLGEDNCCAVSLQRIGSDQDKFSRASLYQRHLNIYDDLSNRDLTDQGGFKIATGGGPIAGERKFGSPFMFENFAKLAFTANQIPLNKDTYDDAYFSRWIVVQFNQQIDKPDKFLIDKITTLDELSGLLNLSLEGLYRLLDTGSFSYYKEAHEIKVEMLRSGSPIANFAYDCLEREDGATITKEVMRSAYLKYAEDNSFPPFTKEKLGRDLPLYAFYVNGDSKDPQGKNAWKNVRFKNKSPDIEENEVEPGFTGLTNSDFSDFFSGS